MESVTTNDQKIYDITLKEQVYATDYLKVTISALATNKSVEIYIDNISGYGDAGNTEVSYVEFNKDRKDRYSNNFGIGNSNAVGTITYTSLTGLPSGLKAYFSEDKTEVLVRGKFANIERGTTAVLSGYDEKGTVFTKKIIFVVGSDTQIVTVTEPVSTEVAYRPNDPKTIQNEESGFNIYSSNIRENYNLVAINPGTYRFDVMVTDDNNESLKASDAVTFNFVAGVTISGKVVDAAGQPVKYGYVTGFTKADEYGRYGSFYVRTEKDGTYVARTLPGDYYTYTGDRYYGGNAYDYSVGNMFYANAVKNFKLPVYKVNIATNIAGAAGYSVSHLNVISSYGVTYRVSDYDDSYDADHSMFVYLPAGSYEVVTYDYDSSDNDITAYGKVEESTEGTFKEYRLLNSLGDYKVSGNFTVNGNSTVVLNAEKKAEQEG